MRHRLVIDTNVWLDWLVFDDPSVAPIAAAVARGDAEIRMSAECLDELSRVLGYDLGKWTLSAEAREAALDRCRTLVRMTEVPDPPPDPVMPRCGDPDDRMFLRLAWACGADYLVTKDDDLLSIRLRGTALEGLRIVGARDVVFD